MQITTIINSRAGAPTLGRVVLAACIVVGVSACQSTAERNDGMQRAGQFAGNNASTQRAGQSMDDNAITTAVKTKLTSDGAANLARVNVTSTNGTVRLSGMVDNPDQKAQASRLAGQVSGVQRVDNDIQIQRSDASEKSDRVLQ